MPRKSRIDAPGALHHAIIRGIERKAIFQDEADRENFLDRLEHILTDSDAVCYAWALMTNHLHLLLRTGPVPLATIMRRLLTGYAVTYNRRHRRARPSLLKPIQIDSLPRGCVSSRAGTLYSP